MALRRYESVNIESYRLNKILARDYIRYRHDNQSYQQIKTLNTGIDIIK